MTFVTDTQFPLPSAAARAVSNALTARIRGEILANGGAIEFDRFMARALYEPGLGYYTAGSAKFGEAGDFVTAPELGNLLARSIALAMAPLLAALETPTVLELGAGTGRLAADLLDACDAHGLGHVRYRILEPSADLRDRQRRVLGARGDRVQWLDALPDDPINGLILANEVADALPVARFVKRGADTRSLGVGWDDERFVWRETAADAALAGRVRDIERQLGTALPDGYRSELCPMLEAWVGSLAKCLTRGAMLFVDYGLVRREYYHEQRTDGTLICHYRQRAHGDPFFLPGLQDISAWVDFSALADAASNARLEVSGFTTQGLFLIESLAALGPDALGLDDPRRQSALKTLVLPGEMGERFKLILLTRDAVEVCLPGRDFRSRL